MSTPQASTLNTILLSLLLPLAGWIAWQTQQTTVQVAALTTSVQEHRQAAQLVVLRHESELAQLRARTALIELDVARIKQHLNTNY